MSALRVAAAVVCCCTLLVAGTYIRQASEPTAEPPAVSRVACAAACDRQAGCGGFNASAARGCRLLKLADADTAEYRRALWPCPSGWSHFRRLCYQYVGGAHLSWTDAQAACQERAAGAQLAVPETRGELTFLQHNPARRSGTAYIGLAVDGSTFTRLDGSVSHLAPELVATADNPGCVHLRGSFRTENFGAQRCSDTLSGYVCQLQERCWFRRPCPSGFTAVLGNCYSYQSTAADWTAAARLCQELLPGAELAVLETHLWHILQTQFAAGVQQWSLHVRPADGSASCAAFSASGEGGVSCATELPFFCRLAARNC
ncbi:Snaclec A11 [Amphibalanus amphitrite]|uniref:Snaclec A11 n=1 Tax=Amphibalanus amphitrite TaxID=1232801 RepID=A0A6A4V8H2_AMPAM|nr:Snaclec A11 [Amphibalanus amphitrite]KAF0290886.1 Snaclec A11 [Amphibalanus amphitrite]